MSNLFDHMSETYEKIHLKDTEIKKGEKTIVVSSKLKLILGWSVFVLCFVLAFIFVLSPSQVAKHADPNDVVEKEVDVKEKHTTTIPYEKDADAELCTFMKDYYSYITLCNNLALQRMVLDPKPYKDNESLKKKAEFITEYSDFTVYTKKSIEEGSYVVFVVSQVKISGVNSKLYDIQRFYVVNGERGYMINNGILSDEVTEYIKTVSGDADIQKIYQSVQEKNEKLKKKDPTIQEQFYDIIEKQKN